ncbi:MAG: MAPEG family protein [Pseudomonadota bacterium]
MLEISSASLSAAGLWTALNLGLMMLLGFNASRVRVRERVVVGTGQNQVLERAVRAHGNNTEWVPGLIICLLVAALLGETETMIHLFGVSLLLARICHAHGMHVLDKPVPPTRLIGNVLSWVIFIAVVLRLLYLSLQYYL